MRGYFGVGVEGISKPMNLGAVMRTAHAFGASFVFTVNAHHKLRDLELSDTAKSLGHVPYWPFETIGDMALPRTCALVGVELTEDAAELPTFRHPRAAAYVLGREKGSLTPDMLARCDHVVRIPTAFCVNVSVAAAIVCYDRVRVMGSWPPRPVTPGGLTEREVRENREARAD